MLKEIENGILDMEKIKYLSNMAIQRIADYDKQEFPSHYNEIISIFTFLDEQITEKYNNLYRTYYGEL